MRKLPGLPSGFDDTLCILSDRRTAGFHSIEWLRKHWIVTRSRIHCTNGSITPEVFESIRCQFGIAGGVLDVAVSQVLLDRPGILPIVGQFVSGGVAQHMWVNLERDAGLAPSPVDDLAYCINGERSLALADKHVGRVRVGVRGATEQRTDLRAEFLILP